MVLRAAYSVLAVFLLASNYLRESEATRGCISVKGSFFESLSQTRIIICGVNQRFSVVLAYSQMSLMSKRPTATVATTMPLSSLRTVVIMPALLIQQGVAKERTERNGHLIGSLIKVILWLPLPSC